MGQVTSLYKDSLHPGLPSLRIYYNPVTIFEPVRGNRFTDNFEILGSDTWTARSDPNL